MDLAVPRRARRPVSRSRGIGCRRAWPPLEALHEAGAAVSFLDISPLRATGRSATGPRRNTSHAALPRSRTSTYFAELGSWRPPGLLAVSVIGRSNDSRRGRRAAQGLRPSRSPSGPTARSRLPLPPPEHAGRHSQRASPQGPPNSPGLPGGTPRHELRRWATVPRRHLVAEEARVAAEELDLLHHGVLVCAGSPAGGGPTCPGPADAADESPSDRQGPRQDLGARLFLARPDGRGRPEGGVLDMSTEALLPTPPPPWNPSPVAALAVVSGEEPTASSVSRSRARSRSQRTRTRAPRGTALLLHVRARTTTRGFEVGAQG